ncbi:hypothetical protein LWI29_018203 [Acer saccharum]|uniref:NADP-dependent oxidoreductase domain-containing protein n=1 Tax=Acer saccharum TaxID=4024 RepID=A0AA39TGI0_ACESA|nr:hypothetical protein LWI29_018203 [Acer saccharum]
MDEKSQINVPRVKLGSQGLEVSRLGFGCAGLSGYYNASIPHEAGCSIKEAFSKGITLFDTADIYGDDHDNEIMVGKALKQLPRDKIQLATKFGFFKLGEEIGVKGTPEYVWECCEASLKRLGVDYIDLYYQHRVDTSVPIEDTMGELKKLVEEGKIKYIGLSEASVDTIRRVYVVHPITAVQMEYSLWAIHPRFIGENLEKNKLIYSRFSNQAAKLACTPPQLALAWLLHQGDDIIPIPGPEAEKVQLATKFGIMVLEGFQFGVRGTPEYVRQCCEASFKRLNMDYIDLYYQHRVDTSVPIEDTVGV